MSTQSFHVVTVPHKRRRHSVLFSVLLLTAVVAVAVRHQAGTSLEHRYSTAPFSDRSVRTATGSTHPAEFIGTVANVLEGDTVDVTTLENDVIRIRLRGVACPESGQPFANQSRDYLRQAIEGSLVIVHCNGQDSYGYPLGDVYARAGLDPYSRKLHSGTHINAELVRAGMARHSVKDVPDSLALADAERAARSAARGMWGGTQKAIAP